MKRHLYMHSGYVFEKLTERDMCVYTTAYAYMHAYTYLPSPPSPLPLPLPHHPAIGYNAEIMKILRLIHFPWTLFIFFVFRPFYSEIRLKVKLIGLGLVGQ